MAYTDHYKLADDIIAHFDKIIDEIDDDFIASRYVGFVAVVSVTVYELAIKEIFIEFAKKEHNLFGEYLSSYFNRLNGRISTDDIGSHINRFGEKYKTRFKRKLTEFETQMVHTDKVSIKESYRNILLWRNNFAHKGIISNEPKQHTTTTSNTQPPPPQVTYNEATKSYKVGKEVIRCLAEFMQNDFDSL